MFNRRFNRSRSNLALWFTLSMGSILVVFAGVIYYLEVLDDLKDLDRLLYKKPQVMAVNAEYEPYKKQVDLENVPLVGSNVPPLGTELVYARWYDPVGLVVQFFGTTPPPHLTVTPGFHTVLDRAGGAKLIFRLMSRLRLLVSWIKRANSMLFQLIGLTALLLRFVPPMVRRRGQGSLNAALHQEGSTLPKR